MLAHHHFDERFSYWEDSHLLMRALVGANLIQMPNALYHYHYHDQMGSNVGQNIEQVAENNLQAIYDYYLNYQHLWRQYLNERDFKVVLAQNTSCMLRGLFGMAIKNLGLAVLRNH